MNHLIKVVLVCFLFSALAANPVYAGSHEIKFAVISDVRDGAIDPVLAFIVSQEVDFIFLAGDFFYDAQDYYPHFIKFGFEATPELPTDQQNLYIVVGNHDAPPAGDENFVRHIAPYYPENGPLSSPEGTIFSFDRQNCHFVITNQYWNYPKGGYGEEQLDWIAQDLSESDQPFKFVVGHEPGFPLDRHVGDSLDIDPEMRDHFWEILTENNVQAYFCGHTHHLSHLLHKGVYQIDAGQVRSSQKDVTIVVVNDENAIISSYESNDTAGLLSIASDRPEDSESFNQIIASQQVGNPSDDVKILFEGTSSDSSGGCFIRTLSTR